MGDSFIETGVDKLVRLVETKKKITLEDASKSLGVSIETIEEWADFLEEEGIITVEYSLTKTYLVAKKISDKELEKKAKDFYGKKDSFVRKIEGAKLALERDTDGLDKFREEFSGLQEHLAEELGLVKEKLQQLEKYERLKKDIDSQIYEQQSDYKKRISEIERETLQQEKRYKEILDNVEISKVKLEEERNKNTTVLAKEEKIREKVELLEGMIQTLKKELKEDHDEVEEQEAYIKDLEKLAETIREDVAKKQEILQELVQESQEHKKNIIASQEDILKQLRDAKSDTKDEVEKSKAVLVKFENFFKKKNDISSLLEKIDKDRHDLEKEYSEILKKAKAYDLAAKNPGVKDHVQELEKQFKEFDKKRNFLSKEVDKLIGLIKG